MILALLRVVNSPFGRVLQAIRENRFRAEALGFRTVFHLTYANCIAALVAAGAGILNALWLRYVGPDTSLSFSIMLDILLMVVIGGMGTIYGAIIGATIFILAQNYLQALMGVASKAAPKPACRCCRGCCIPTAGCCGSGCCSSPASTSSRPAWSDGCAIPAATRARALRIKLRFMMQRSGSLDTATATNSRPLLPNEINAQVTGFPKLYAICVVYSCPSREGECARSLQELQPECF